jgi:hypothetical protein
LVRNSGKTCWEILILFRNSGKTCWEILILVRNSDKTSHLKSLNIKKTYDV